MPFDPYAIIIRPLLTEKAYRDLAENNVYWFEVARRATKPEIRRAVEELFQVEVLEVRTLIMRGKVKRWGMRMGKRPNWKKAMVRIQPGKTIPLFEGK
jgi:large subunit ribosomal protein L23